MTSPLRPAIMQGLIPTKIAGTFLSPPPAADFHPDKASPTVLRAHGFHWQKPAASAPAAAKKAWDDHFGAGWAAGTHLVPELVTTGKMHRPRHRKGAHAPGHGRGGGHANPVSEELTNWGGGVVNGTWSLAFGTWNVPTVSKPTEAPGPGGGWDSSTWVGIDGSGSNDVLQAGIEQQVDARGKTSYVAWYEWFCSIQKQTLSDTSPVHPSLASLNGRLYIAWTGNRNQKLNVMVSTDGGQTFHNKLVSGDTSPHPPVLCAHAGRLYIGWTGNGNKQLNVAQVSLDGAGSPTALAGKVVLGDTSPQGPALASLGGNLYLGWNGNGNDKLNVMVSTDGGRTFGSKLVAGDTSPQAPTLAAHDNRLLIAWTGERNRQLNVAQVTLQGAVPKGLAGKVVLGDTSPFTPALVSTGANLFLAWRGNGNDALNVMVSTNGGATFAGKHTSHETSTDAPVLVAQGGNLFIGWKGDGNDNLNVSFVGMVGGQVTGFTTPQYVFQVNIPNFKVTPGDKVSCSVQYIGNKTAGQIAFKNETQKVSFAITLVPPPGAAMSGNSAEWVIEVPTVSGGYAHLPSFTPVNFTGALACGAGAIGNPQKGFVVTILDDASRGLTSTSLGNATVGITYVPPPVVVAKK